MITDTHTHLYMPEFDPPREAVERAMAAGVGHMVLPNVDLSTIAPMKALHTLFPDNTSMAMGLHPTEVREGWKDDLDVVESELTNGGYVAVGEVGIDLYWDKTYLKEQMLAFERQCDMALAQGLPVIVHCREGLDQTLEVISSKPGLTGVMHSFTGTAEDAERVMLAAPGFMFGINGILTFKKSTLPVVLPALGADRILLETDSPYLAPVPYRGKRNESSYIVHTARAAASALGMEEEQLIEATNANARRLGLLPA